MSACDATRLRLKQDFLLMLTVDNLGTAEHLAIDDGGPSLASLRPYIWPEWEYRIDQLIRFQAAEQHIGIPNWATCAQPRKSQ